MNSKLTIAAAVSIASLLTSMVGVIYWAATIANRQSHLVVQLVEHVKNDNQSTLAERIGKLETRSGIQGQLIEKLIDNVAIGGKR